MTHAIAFLAGVVIGALLAHRSQPRHDCLGKGRHARARRS